ncbi:MAG: N-acetyltransferase [Gammaproteobacteria bacterium]|nr:N-acetyltransferase [Gammaproteobacteria bacterium]
MKIRNEQASDIKSIYQVNVRAFETSEEAQLVNALRDSGCEYILLVAEIDNRVVAYILFTPVSLVGSQSGLKLLGLAPMAVLPEYQNQGIGSALVRRGLELCKAKGYDAVVVLGHPNYYPRFGFVASDDYGIQSEYDVPREVFMIKELTADCLKDQQGVIQYHKAFNLVG